MEKKENRRVRLTKQLLKEKDTAKISISELGHKAGINRTTFYYHYGSQHDLLENIASRFSRKFSPAIYEALGCPLFQLLAMIGILDSRII
jgi:AcrR family transcriptional regulator